ncbi:toxin VasX [Tenacibaculum sp.]|uniref:toxin VasX n=1 Tax=Tenacibaculum sp. TaxID=1906242 RepID=UPI003D150C8C
MASIKDSTLTTLTFECSYGDIVTEEKPKIRIKEPGVHLHFLRYGLFDKGTPDEERQYVQYDTNLKEEEKRVKEEEEQLLLQIKNFELEKSLIKRDNTSVNTTKKEIVPLAEEKVIELEEVIVKGKKHKIEGLPEFNNFYHSKTSLNEGYIYLINKNKPDEYFELYVHNNGDLQHINWGYSKNKGKDGKVLDVRVPDSNDKKVRAKRIDPPGKELWVAYSIAQWSREYHEMMINDEELRKKRMKLIKCDALKKDEERTPTEDYELAPVPYHKAYAVYADKHDVRVKDMHQTLRDIHLDEKQEDENGDNDEYQDLFFVLDDPLGMAQDVADVLNIAHDKHRATIESMQTGESEKEIFNRLQTKPDATSKFITTDYGQQANALFTNALTLHNFIHNTNQDIKDEYEDSVDFNKINKILGFEYRAKQRERIAAVRKDYLELIKSEYYKTAFVDGLRGNDQDTFENRSIIASQLSLLTEHPQHKDRFIDPSYKYKGNEDTDFDNFIANSVNSNDEHYQLFTKEINIDNLTQSNKALNNSFSLSRTVVKSLKDVTTAYTREAYLVKDTEILNKTIKAFKDSNGWNIKINTKALDKTLSETNTELFPFLIEKEGVLFGKKGKILKIRASKSIAQQAAKTKSITLQTQGLGNNTSKLLKEILDSPRFRKWMAGIELINTIIKAKSIYDERSFKNGISTFGAFSSLTSAVLSYQEASLKVAGAVDETIILVGKVGRVTGLVGSAVSVGMCFSDMVASIKVNDNDAAIAWGLTGLVSGVLLIEGLVYFASWSSLVASGGLGASAAASGIFSGGVTIALTLVVFGGIGLAIYLTDSPLEKFIKNNILSKENTWNSKTTIPYAYMRELHTNKDDLVDSEVSRWRDFVVAADDLYDLLISYKVESELSNPVDLEKKKNSSWSDDFKDLVRTVAGTKLYGAKTITIAVTLRKFYYDKSEFRYALALFPKEIKHNKQQKPILLSSTRTILETSNGLNTLKITFTMSEYLLKLISISSEFVFFSNTLINDEFNEYWPSQRGATRYHAYKFDADYKIHGVGTVAAANMLGDVSHDFMSAYLGENIRVGTEEELVLPKTWK